MNFKDYLTSEEAAKFLGVSPQTLRRWVTNDKVKSYKNPINGFFLYKKEDLQEILNNTCLHKSAKSNNKSVVEI